MRLIIQSQLREIAASVQKTAAKYSRNLTDQRAGSGGESRARIYALAASPCGGGSAAWPGGQDLSGRYPERNSFSPLSFLANVPLDIIVIPHRCIMRPLHASPSLSRCSCPSTFPSAVIIPRCKLHNPVTVGISCRFSKLREHRSFSPDYRRSIDARPFRRVFPRAMDSPLREIGAQFTCLRGSSDGISPFIGWETCVGTRIYVFINWFVDLVDNFYRWIFLFWEGKEIKKSLVFNEWVCSFQLKRDNRKIVNSILCNIS